jgi:hypothetical protein
MATMTRPAPAGTDPAAGVADVFVIFRHTGDLAKVMTFHSLYRLEARRLLDCPIVGVAVDDRTVTSCATEHGLRSKAPVSRSTRRCWTGSSAAWPTCRTTSATTQRTSLSVHCSCSSRLGDGTDFEQPGLKTARFCRQLWQRDKFLKIGRGAQVSRSILES